MKQETSKIEIVEPIVTIHIADNKTEEESPPVTINKCKEESLKQISEAMAKSHVTYD